MSVKISKIVVLALLTFSLIQTGCIIDFPGPSGKLLYGYVWGGLANDAANNISIDSTDNIYVAGNFQDTVDFNPGPFFNNHSSNGGIDCYLSKFDSLGVHQGTLAWGGTGADSVIDIAFDSSDNVYVVGYFTNTVDFDPFDDGNPGTTSDVEEHTAVGASDCFVSKFDAIGNFQWVKTWGSSNNDEARAIIIDSSDYIYVAGFFSGLTDFDPGVTTNSIASNGSEDCFLSRFDSFGVYELTNCWGGVQTDIVTSMTVDTTNNVYTVGSYAGTVDFDPVSGPDNHISNGSSDCFLNMFNSAGVFGWAKTWGGTAEDKPNAIDSDSKDTVYITGKFGNTVDFDPSVSLENYTSNGGSDCFISKFDSAGDLLWAKAWGGNNDDETFDIAVHETTFIYGWVYVTGFYQDTVDFNTNLGSETFTAKGDKDSFYSEFDTEGYYSRTRVWGGTLADSGISIDIDSNNSVNITGEYEGTVDLDAFETPTNRTSNGGTDCYMSRFINLAYM